MSSLESALRGELAHWQGLDHGLTEDALAATLREGWSPSPRQPGRLAGQLVTHIDWRARCVHPTLIRAWFRGDSRDVLMLELEEPASDLDPEAIEDVWGPPRRSAPGRRFAPDGWTTELVYPERGAALTVARSFDNDPSFPDFPPRISHAMLFEPTDMQTWVVALGGDDLPGPGR